MATVIESSTLKFGDVLVKPIDAQARRDISSLDTRMKNIEENGTGSGSSETSEKVVVCYKNGNDYQIRMPLEDKVYCVPMKNKGSANGTLDFIGQAMYVSADIKSTEKITATSAYAFKNWTDDICPVHYNNEYRCAGHGISGAFNITCTNHGLTEADIGSLWQSANGVKEVIISIIDANTILVVSDDTGNKTSPVTKTKPTSPLTHVSGATHTANIAFTQADFRYVTPSCNGQTFMVRSADGELLEEDGLLISEEYIDIIESYYSLNYQETIAYLKANVGNNKNDTYYNEDRIRELFYQSTYRFFTSGCCLISFSATPLKESVNVDYFGGTQSTGLGTIKFVPYTKNYKEPTSYTEVLSFLKDTWEDETFPPYKFFEISDDHPTWAFGVGYVVDYGQGKAEVRKESNSAGNIHYPGNKMYPFHYYDASSSSKSGYGKSFSGYVWKAPMIIKDNRIMTWYAIGEEIYIEVEFLGEYNGYLELPNVCDFKRIEVLKKTDTVQMPIETVSDGGIYCIASGVGSMTIKCY